MQFVIVVKDDVDNGLRHIRNYHNAYRSNGPIRDRDNRNEVLAWACQRMSRVLQPTAADCAGHPTAVYDVEHFVVADMLRDDENSSS